jgi:hypothetical protein
MRAGYLVLVGLLLGLESGAWPAQGGVVVDVLDRDVLVSLEQDPEDGYALHVLLDRLLGSSGAPPERWPASNAWMAEHSPAYRGLSDAWSEHVQGAIDRVERPLVVEHEDAKAFPAGNVGRAFDVRWFRSDKAFFQLVGVVNRLDRADFSQESCGEVRFLYRLAYAIEQPDGGVHGSRLPFTVNVVLESRDTDDCAAVARRWVAPAGEMDSKKRKAWLGAGPLQGLTLKQVEVNAQVVRFPSGLETEFGGQAVYLLRVYGLAPYSEKEGRGVRVVYKTLENTPDVRRLQQDEALKNKLVAFLGEHLEDVDRGVYRLPEEFLATEALSYSTLGVNRLANKPFDLLFEGEEGRARLPKVTGSLSSLSSRRALVERLNNRTCMGCHQAQSTAGFHFLGREDPGLVGITNRLQLPFSGHYSDERARRQRHVAKVAAGEDSASSLLHSLAPVSADQGYLLSGANMSCVPQEHEADYPLDARWGCASKPRDLECRVVARDPRVAINFGQCVVRQEKTETLFSGMTCRAGTLSSLGSAGDEGPVNQHAYKDTFSASQIYSLSEDKPFFTDSFNCRPTVIGVPLGRTYRRCTGADRGLDEVLQDGGVADDICAVVGGSRFDQCVEGDFHSCLEGILSRGMVDTCHSKRSCREDYICQALPYQHPSVATEAGERLHKAGVGFCTPTYFLFQLRLDGHPVP